MRQRALGATCLRVLRRVHTHVRMPVTALPPCCLPPPHAAPTTFSNLYFAELTNNKWKKKKWSGPLQYEDKSGTLMMLSTDMCVRAGGLVGWAAY